MKKNESLMATLLSIYAILLTISIAIYALIQELKLDIALTTNLLIWSATLFAPIAVLMTYTSWREQKHSELLSNIAKDEFLSYTELHKLINDLDGLFQCLLSDPNNEKYKESFDNGTKIVFDFKKKIENESHLFRHILLDEQNSKWITVQMKISVYMNVIVAQGSNKVLKSKFWINPDQIFDAKEEMDSAFINYKMMLVSLCGFAKMHDE